MCLTNINYAEQAILDFESDKKKANTNKTKIDCLASSNILLTDTCDSAKARELTPHVFPNSLINMLITNHVFVIKITDI